MNVPQRKNNKNDRMSLIKDIVSISDNYFSFSKLDKLNFSTKDFNFSYSFYEQKPQYRTVMINDIEFFDLRDYYLPFPYITFLIKEYFNVTGEFSNIKKLYVYFTNNTFKKSTSIINCWLPNSEDYGYVCLGDVSLHTMSNVEIINYFWNSVFSTKDDYNYHIRASTVSNFNQWSKLTINQVLNKLSKFSNEHGNNVVADSGLWENMNGWKWKCEYIQGITLRS